MHIYLPVSASFTLTRVLYHLLPPYVLTSPKIRMLDFLEREGETPKCSWHVSCTVGFSHRDEKALGPWFDVSAVTDTSYCWFGTSATSSSPLAERWLLKKSYEPVRVGCSEKDASFQPGFPRHSERNERCSHVSTTEDSLTKFKKYMHHAPE